ncbi:MAG: hypothetical protein PWP31_1971 [Clostridia bacterium]|nr:hypothetical protein [Clostridia bacterium]
MENNKQELAELAKDMKRAKEDWLVAERFFSEVTEPELIDQAIYRLQEAERRYMYLWKKMREKEFNSQSELVQSQLVKDVGDSYDD